MNRRFFLKVLGFFGITSIANKVIDASQSNIDKLPVIKFTSSKAEGIHTINSEELFNNIPWQKENVAGNVVETREVLAWLKKENALYRLYDSYTWWQHKMELYWGKVKVKEKRRQTENQQKKMGFNYLYSVKFEMVAETYCQHMCLNLPEFSYYTNGVE